MISHCAWTLSENNGFNTSNLDTSTDEMKFKDAFKFEPKILIRYEISEAGAT